ncbi:MAG: hypothetical protein AAF614_07880 [Chloroflexota bacterium]
MTTRSVKLNLPDQLYKHFQKRAAITSRSVEDELVDTLLTQTEEALSQNLTHKLDSMSLLDDNALWNAARSHLSQDLAEKLESLNLKQQREGLTTSEQENLEQLASQYEQIMLVRARATSLLNKRGFDISLLLTQEQ